MKFAKPENRQQLIIETGFRCHITDFDRAIAPTPSGFVTRLRKYLKSRRVTSVTQVGTDRIIEIQFSDGYYRLFLEFYAAGNIVLTDNDLKILALFRMVHEGADQEELRVGLTYLLDHRQNVDGVPDLTNERLRNGLQKAVDEVDGNVESFGKEFKRKKDHALRKALVNSLKEFSPILIDHALGVFHLDPSTKVKDILTDDALFSRLTLALAEAQKVVENMMKPTNPQGYIIAKSRKQTIPEPDSQTGVRLDPSPERNEKLFYEEFHPFIPSQYLHNPDFKVIELDGFNRTVDEFYSSIEAQHVQSRLSERDENAKRKLEAARQDHEKRLDRLQQTQEIHYQKAQALEANLQDVKDAIAAINGLIAQGMGWVEIERLIEMEQAKQNSIAEMIRLPLKLHENSITLLLKSPSFDEEDGFAGNGSDSSVSDGGVDRAEREEALKTARLSKSRLAVDVDLGLSPWSNARLYYEQKKTVAVKEQKTLQSSVKALKNTERKISADLNKALKQEKEVLRPVRKPFWFEKFFFFISSEGYLVLGGRDITQTEILYSKYLKRGDVYVYADLRGAASVIVKNKSSLSQSPIPPSTLAEAGTLAVVTSSAWESKAVMSAWWVPASEVSKISATGEYLPAGEFAILGQKRFLPPAQLLLGFGVMFHISEESKANHYKNRIPIESTSNTDDLAGESMPGVANLTEGEEGDEQDIRAIQGESFTNNSYLSGHPEASRHASENSLNVAIEEKGAQFSNLECSNLLQADEALAEDRDTDASTKDLVSELENATFASKLQGEPFDEHDLDADMMQPEESTKSDVSLPTTHQSSVGDGSEIGKKNRKSTTDHLPTIQIGEADNSSGVSSSVPAGILSSGAQALSAKQKHPVRGKRGKVKKAKTKYGDQDDEDRKAALRLLGSVAAREKAEKDALTRAAREQELEAIKQRRQRQLIVAAEKGKVTEQLRQNNFQAEFDQSDDEENEGTVDFETFVGTLLPGDDILDAFVVCGPWNAVGTRCRWKVKLQPGAIKKGKVVREILTRWSSEIVAQGRRQAGPSDSESVPNDESTEMRERELLKSFKEQEVVGAIPVSKCKLMTGAAKIVDGKIKGISQGGGASHKYPRRSK